MCIIRPPSVHRAEVDGANTKYPTQSSKHSSHSMLQSSHSQDHKPLNKNHTSDLKAHIYTWNLNHFIPESQWNPKKLWLHYNRKNIITAQISHSSQPPHHSPFLTSHPLTHSPNLTFHSPHHTHHDSKHQYSQSKQCSPLFTLLY